VPTERVLASFGHLNQVRERANAGARDPGESEGAPSIFANTRSQTSAPARPLASSLLSSGPAANTPIYTFLTALRDRDIHISADGDRLRCSAPAGALTSDLRDELQRRKSEILQFLHSAGALVQQQPAIVPLQPNGKRTPVFAVGGHNGDVFCFRALAKHLVADQPFYGLQPQGLDGKDEPLRRVEDLAAYFADQIRAFQPNGPYIIAGYCAGGTIAFELARQLRRDGATIDFLALFGSPFPTWYRALPQFRVHLGLQLKRFVRHTHAMASLSLNQRRLYIAERLHSRKAHRASERNAPPDPAIVRRHHVGRITRAALPHYEPGHFAGRLVLFLPDQWLCPREVTRQWRGIAQSVEEHFGPEGCTGDNMLREPHARALAQLFTRCCATHAPIEQKPEQKRPKVLSPELEMAGR
jgi:thioesterase domain-containing protein